MAPSVVVEPKGHSSIAPFSTLNANARTVQSAYQQSDTSFFTQRRAGELPTDASEILVIQYGSRNFKVGMAKDALPRTASQVIAHRDAQFSQDDGEIDNGDLITEKDFKSD